MQSQTSTQPKSGKQGDKSIPKDAQAGSQDASKQNKMAGRNSGEMVSDMKKRQQEAERVRH